MEGTVYRTSAVWVGGSLYGPPVGGCFGTRASPVATRILLRSKSSRFHRKSCETPETSLLPLDGYAAFNRLIDHCVVSSVESAPESVNRTRSRVGWLRGTKYAACKSIPEGISKPKDSSSSRSERTSGPSRKEERACKRARLTRWMAKQVLDDSDDDAETQLGWWPVKKRMRDRRSRSTKIYLNAARRQVQLA